MGQEKHNKNADILTLNTAVLPSLSDTISLSCSTVYSESSSHPSSESSTSCSLSTAMKSRFIYPLLQKISRCIFTDMNIKTKQQEVIKLSPFIGRMLVLKPVSFGCVFQDNKSRSSGARAYFHGTWKQLKKRGSTVSYIPTYTVCTNLPVLQLSQMPLSHSRGRGQS